MADGNFCLRQLVGEIFAEQVGDPGKLHVLEDEFRQRTEPVGEHWVRASCDNCASGVLAIYGIDTRFAETDETNLDGCPNPITDAERQAIGGFIYRNDIAPARPSETAVQVELPFPGRDKAS